MGIFSKKRLKIKEKVMEQYVVRLYRGLGTSLAKRLVNTKITPNQITVTGFIFAITASLFFITSKYPSMIIGSVILFFSVVLDFTDGTLARMRNQASIFGDWLDALMDDFREILIIVSLCTAVYRNNPLLSIWILGFVILATDRLIFRTTDNVYKLLPYDENTINKQVKQTFTSNIIFRIGKQFLSVRLLKYTLLPIFVVFKVVYAYLVFAAVYGVILCVAFLAYSAFKIKVEEHRSKQ